MTTRLHEGMYSRSLMTFEDLKGLRAEGYIRDSTLDQRDGFGPEIQRNNIQRFAETYGLPMGDRWYTEFVSGRSVAKRDAFRHNGDRQGTPRGQPAFCISPMKIRLRSRVCHDGEDEIS